MLKFVNTFLFVTLCFTLGVLLGASLFIKVYNVPLEIPVLPIIYISLGTFVQATILRKIGVL